MAKPTNGANDFVQIVMLTFFLCALFFGGWGGYVWWTVEDYRDQRKTEQDNLTRLRKTLRDPKKQQVEKEWLRRKEARSGDEGLVASVDWVLAKIGDRDWIKGSSDRAKPQKGTDLMEQTYNVDFNERPLRNYVNFLAILEQSKPHVQVSDLELNHKGKAKEDDLYSGRFVFLSYEKAKAN